MHIPVLTKFEHHTAMYNALCPTVKICKPGANSKQLGVRDPFEMPVLYSENFALARFIVACSTDYTRLIQLTKHLSR